MLLVVGPFLALVLLALWWSGGSPAPAVVIPAIPSAARSKAVESNDAGGPAALHASPAPVGAAPGPMDEPRWPRALEAPLRAVTPEVLRCFDDQRAHLHEVQRLEVRFRPLNDGGFAEVRVPSTGNPYLAACVEDVFDEVGFVPSGAETFEVATHRFTWDPDGGTRTLGPR